METIPSVSNKTSTVVVNVKARYNENQTSRFNAVVVQPTKSERIVLGVKALAVCWTVTLFCLLIPVVHFVLVPAGFLIGIFMFFQKYSLEERLLSGVIQCPKCQQIFDVEKGAFNWPRQEICPHCGTEMILSHD